MPSSPQAAGCKAFRATALRMSPSPGAHRLNPVLPTPSPGATALELPLPRSIARQPPPPQGSPHGFCFLAGGTDGPFLPSVPTSRPGMEAHFSITPHKTPALPGLRRPGRAPPFLTPLGSRPTVPPPSPPPGAKAPEAQPCAGNAASAPPWAPRPLPCPLSPTPASVTTSKGICSRTPSLPADLIKLY